jgi:hypothetical protein
MGRLGALALVREGTPTVSGWIKLEKDLLTDPRFVATAMELEERYGLAHKGVTERNVTTLPASTLLIGALARIWIIADTHIGEDDILALNAHQIDKLVGIKGLCEILPDDWLEVLDGDRVKLPNYHIHNGSTAKERSSNALRQQRFRDKQKQNIVTSRNAVTLPDKTKIRPREEKEQEARNRARGVTGLDLQAWESWVSYRAERKPAIKVISLVAAAEELARFGAEQAAVVKHSVAQGYQGLVAPKAGLNGKHPEDTGWRPSK